MLEQVGAGLTGEAVHAEDRVPGGRRLDPGSGVKLQPIAPWPGWRGIVAIGRMVEPHPNYWSQTPEQGGVAIRDAVEVSCDAAVTGGQATTWRIWCTITITAEASSTCDPAVLPISVASRWYGSTRAARYSSTAVSMSVASPYWSITRATICRRSSRRSSSCALQASRCHRVFAGKCATRSSTTFR